MEELNKNNILKKLSQNSDALEAIARDMDVTSDLLKKYLVHDELTATLFVDGGARGNPGEAGAGIVFQLNSIKEGHFFYIQHSTNNMAEYIALFQGLKIAHKNKVKNIIAYSDSELVCKQINGEYKIKNQNLYKIYQKCCLLIEKLNSFKINHIPREKNKEADKLVNIAINSRQNGKIELTVAES